MSWLRVLGSGLQAGAEVGKGLGAGYAQAAQTKAKLEAERKREARQRRLAEEAHQRNVLNDQEKSWAAYAGELRNDIPTFTIPGTLSAQQLKDLEGDDEAIAQAQAALEPVVLPSRTVSAMDSRVLKLLRSRGGYAGNVQDVSFEDVGQLLVEGYFHEAVDLHNQGHLGYLLEQGSMTPEAFEVFAKSRYGIDFPAGSLRTALQKTLAEHGEDERFSEEQKLLREILKLGDTGGATGEGGEVPDAKDGEGVLGTALQVGKELGQTGVDAVRKVFGASDEPYESPPGPHAEPPTSETSTPVPSTLKTPKPVSRIIGDAVKTLGEAGSRVLEGKQGPGSPPSVGPLNSTMVDDTDVPSARTEPLGDTLRSLGESARSTWDRFRQSNDAYWKDQAPTMRDAIVGKAPERPVTMRQVGTSDAPIGVRNNNPGNLRPLAEGQRWGGQVGEQGGFSVFKSVEDGVRAAARNLMAYAEKHGLGTVREVISRWAPSNENDTNAYVNHVAQRLSVAPDAPLDVLDPGVLVQLLEAIFIHENGPQAFKDMNISKDMLAEWVNKERSERA